MALLTILLCALWQKSVGTIASIQQSSREFKRIDYANNAQSYHTLRLHTHKLERKVIFGIFILVQFLHRYFRCLVCNWNVQLNVFFILKLNPLALISFFFSVDLKLVIGTTYLQQSYIYILHKCIRFIP